MELISGDFVRAIPGFCQPISSIMHLAGASVAVVAAIPLVRLARGSRHHSLAISVYAFCVIATFATSGTYHALARGCSARAFMQRVDHFAIWLLIAGTFTAVHGVMCKGFWRFGMLIFIWSYACVGMLLQFIWFEVFSGPAGLLIYLGLGWLGVISIYKLGRQIGFRAVRPVWYAGVAFSVGAVLEATGHPILVRRYIGPHEIFHLAVIVGVALHWSFIRRLLISHVPALNRPGATAPASLSAGAMVAG